MFFDFVKSLQGKLFFIYTWIMLIFTVLTVKCGNFGIMLSGNVKCSSQYSQFKRKTSIQRFSFYEDFFFCQTAFMEERNYNTNKQKCWMSIKCLFKWCLIEKFLAPLYPSVFLCVRFILVLMAMWISTVW